MLDPSRPVPPLLVTQLRQLMSASVGVVRSREAMTDALEQIDRLEQTAGETNLFSNLTTSAKLIAAGALAREESRGGHFRSDFPEARNVWRHRTFLTLDDARRIASNAADRPATQEGFSA